MKYPRLLSSAAALALACSAANATDYYVDQDGGSNANNGTTQGAPWKTIQHAANNMVAGDTCHIMGGTYRETVTPANSGTASNPITYRAADGETVVISGLDPIYGWSQSQHNNNIYVANLTGNLQSLGHEDQVFQVNGSNVVSMWEARWPNTSNDTFQALLNSFQVADGGSASTLQDSALTQPADHWNGATVWYVGGQGGWLGQTGLIADSAPGILTLQTNPNHEPPVSGSEYYISGVLAELDMAREWHIDSVTNKIHLWTPNGAWPSNIQIKQRVQGFVIENKSHIHVEGIDFLATNIQLNNADYCSIDDINAQYVYSSDQSIGYGGPTQNQFAKAINIKGDYNMIQNSVLGHSTGSMIQLSGTGNQVVNNFIHDTTKLGGYSASVHLSKCDNAVVSHNTFRGTGRSAIASIDWVTDCLIQNNEISDYMWFSADGAAIYFWGMDMGNTEIRYNIVRDGKGLTNGYNHTEAHGIYFDSQSSYVIVHHNVVYDTRDNSCDALRFNRPAVHRLAYNNTLIDNPGKAFSLFQNPNYHGDLFGAVLMNNIMTNGFEEIDDILMSNNITSEAGLSFVNRANHNYRPTAGSSAIDAGGVVASITNGYAGSAPDAGAYEFNGTDWNAGHDFNNLPAPDLTRTTSKHMNLLPQGGFDQLTKWQLVGSPTVDLGSVSVPSGTLSRGARTRLRMSGGVNQGVEQTVTGLKSNTTYRLSGWVYSDQGVHIKFGAKNFGGAEVSVSAYSTHYNQRRDVLFTTGASQTQATVFITKASSGSGFIYADDFGLVEISSGGTGGAVFEDSFAGTSIDPWWNYEYSPGGFITQNGALNFSRPATNPASAAGSAFFGRATGLDTVTDVAYIAFDISNFTISSGSGTPWFAITGSPQHWGNDYATRFSISQNGSYQVFVNNSAGSLPYSDTGSISGNLASQSWALYRNGVQVASGNSASGLSAGQSLTSLGWGIWAGSTTTAGLSMNIDNFVLNDQIDLQPSSGGALAPGRYLLRCVGTNRYLSGNNVAWGVVNSGPLAAGGTSLNWELELDNGITYRAKCDWGGYYLSGNNVTNGVVNNGPLATGGTSLNWDFEHISGNEYHIKCDWGDQYLQGDTTGNWNDTINSPLDTNNSAQRWELIPIN